nr:hypothetical protein [Tanacetum cinerariifolium]
MSNTNNNKQTQTSNTLHNAIMEAGSKDRPPMLAPGWKDKEVPTSEGSLVTRTERVNETYNNVLQDIRDQLNAEAEAVQIILTGIDNDIYSTFDACPVLLKSQELKTVSYHELYDILKQHQHEVNEIRAEKIARVANPLALVAQQQPVYHPQHHPTHFTQNSSTRSQQAATRNRGKAIVNTPQPIYDQEPSMKIYKPTNNNLRTSLNTSRANQDNSPRINKNVGYENQRIGTVAGARETVGSTVVQKYRIQCYNCKEFGHVVRECQKPKRAKDVAYHREKMLLCKQEEAGIQLNVKQADWKDNTDDDELEDQELEVHYMYMAQLQQVSPDAADSGPIFDDEPLQKVSNDAHYNVFTMESTHPKQSKSMHDTYPIEQDAQNVIIDSLDMNYDKEEIDQNDNDNDLAKEREIEDFKNKNKSLESSNNFFKETNNRLSETNNLLYADYKKSEAELARRNTKEYASQMELECAKKPKRVKDAAYHKEKMLLCKQEEVRIQLNAEQADWKDDTDDEFDDQELEAHYIEEIDQNADDNDLAKERSSGPRRFFRYAMFLYSCYLCYFVSLYPFTERYAQPYFFSCFDTAVQTLQQGQLINSALAVAKYTSSGNLSLLAVEK